MKYPWTMYKNTYMRALMSGSTPEEGVEAANAVLTGKGFYAFRSHEAIQRSNFCLAVWARSGQRVIHVSPAAQVVLEEVLHYLSAENKDPLRWRSVPNPGNPWYDRPLMFYFEPLPVSEDRVLEPQVTFAQSIGELFDERVRYAHWMRDRERATLWLPQTSLVYPRIITEAWWETVKTPAQVYYRYREFVGGMTLSKIISLHWVNMTMLCLAALSREERIPILRSRRARKKSRKSSRGVSPVNFDLDPSGLFVWRREYVVAETGKSEPREYPNDRNSPSLHHVRGHEVLKWVLPEHVRKNEEVVQTKIREDGQKLCGVMRWRRETVRGNEMSAKKSRMRVGVDDINI